MLFWGGEFESYCFIEPSLQFYENAIRLAADDKRILGVNALFDADIYFTVNKKVKEIEFILCSSLLHEVEDPGSLLEEISRICGPETMLHINVPNAKSIHRLIAYEMGIIGEVKELSQRNRAFQQTNVFDMRALKELVSSHGFDVVEEGSYFVKPFTHDQMFSIIEKGIIDIDVLDGLYKISKYLPDFGSEIYVNCRMKR